MGVRVASILDILDELAATLDAGLNGGAGGVQIIARRSFTPSTPSIDMWPGNAGEQRDPDTAAFGDTAGALLATVRARVAASDHRAQQELLYQFCDDEGGMSVAAILMEDQTLSGLAGSVNVLGPSEPSIYQDVAGQVPLLGVQWRVEIIEADS